MAPTPTTTPTPTQSSSSGGDSSPLIPGLDVAFTPSQSLQYDGNIQKALDTIGDIPTPSINSNPTQNGNAYSQDIYNALDKIGSPIKNNGLPNNMVMSDGVAYPVETPQQKNMAMQFPLPSTGVTPDSINSQSTNLDSTAQQLKSLRDGLITDQNTIDLNDQDAVNAYNQKVDSFNALKDKLNTGIDSYNKDLNDYNSVQSVYNNVFSNKDEQLAYEMVNEDPTQTGFLGVLKNNFIPTQFINSASSSLINDARAQVNQQYMQDHPVLGGIASAIGQLSNLLLIGKAGGGFGLADSAGVRNIGEFAKVGVGKVGFKAGQLGLDSIASGLSDVSTGPQIGRIIAKGAESGSIFGISNALQEIINQKAQGQLNAGKLLSKTAEGIGTGFALGGAGAGSTLAGRTITGGVTMGSITALDTLLQSGKIKSSDLTNILVNTIIGAGFELAGGRDKSGALRGEEMGDISKNQMINSMIDDRMSKGMTRAEAKADAQKTYNLLGTLHAIVKGGIYQQAPSSIVQQFENLPSDFFNAPTEAKYTYFKAVADNLMKDENKSLSTIGKAIDETNKQPEIRTLFKNIMTDHIKAISNILQSISKVKSQVADENKPTISQEKIPIARHGDNLLDEKGISAGHDQPGLTASGRKQIEDNVAKEWKDQGIQNVISSDATRAKQSSQIVADSIGAKVITDPRLRTQDIGDLANKPEDIVKPIVKDMVNNHPDQKVGKTGESFNEFKARFEAGYKDQLAKNGGDKNAFMLHGDGEKLVRSDFGRNMKEYNADGIEHGKTTEVAPPKDMKVSDEAKFNKKKVGLTKEEQDIQAQKIAVAMDMKNGNLTDEEGKVKLAELDKKSQIPQFNKEELDENGRKKLPEVPVNIGRVKEYTDRLKIRGIDTKIMDAIITRAGVRAYGISYGNKIGLESIVQKFTEDHEIGHAIWTAREEMTVFKGFDWDALDKDLYSLYGDVPKELVDEGMTQAQWIGENVMQDFQQYQNDKENNRPDSVFGKIREFFEKLRASLRRWFRNEKDIKEFYRIMTEAKAKEETVIKDNTPERFNRMFNQGVVDFRANEEAIAGFNKEIPAKDAFNDEGDLTLKTITKLQGRTTVSKEFIDNLTNSADIKQVERDLIREALKTEGNTVNVKEFADKVKVELLPLKILKSPDAGYKDTRLFEGMVLPDELRGNVSNYTENVYQSPINTEAGNIHFSYLQGVPGMRPDHYFGHTRIEDMGDKNTRRVIEVQSDLFQKGNLEKENSHWTLLTGNENLIKLTERVGKSGVDKMMEERRKEVQKLGQYNDPTAHFRMVREEIRQAAKDGKTRLQFPTGETAMKIEGLGEANRWSFFPEEDSEELVDLSPSDLKVGLKINMSDRAQNWVITDVLGDGKFRAITKYKLDQWNGNIDEAKHDGAETFDISGKVDTNNPIYRFYEKDLGRYLKNNYNAVPVTDDKGVTWYEVPIEKGMAKLPVPAFNVGERISGLRSELDAAQRRLDMAVANQDQEGMSERIPELKEAVDKLRQKISDLKNPPLIKARAVLVHAENRVGTVRVKLPTAPKIRIANANIQLSDDLYQRHYEITAKKEYLQNALENHPGKKLMPFVSKKEGDLLDTKDYTNSKKYTPRQQLTIKESAAKRNRVAESAFEGTQSYDQFSDVDIQRQAIADYQEKKAELKELTQNEKALGTEIKTYIIKEKDELAKNLIAQHAETADEKQIALEKKRLLLNIAQAKVNKEEEKAQDLRRKLEELRYKAVESDVLNTLNPLNTEAIQKNHKPLVTAFRKYTNGLNEAKIVGLKHKESMPEVDKLGTEAFDLFQQGYLEPTWQKKIGEIFDSLYDFARKNGFPDLGYVSTYLPQIYAGNAKDLENAQIKKMKSLGMTDQEIEEYMQGKKLSQDKSLHLKINPFFSKDRFFTSYAEAETYGLLPKYKTMSDLITHYETTLLKTSAARGLVNDLQESGEIAALPVNKNWKVITFGPNGIEGHYASPVVTHFLNNYFKGHAQMNKFQANVIVPISNISRFIQRLKLSAGVPFTSIDPFAVGMVSRELARGNIKVLKSIIKSNSTDATMTSLKSNYKYLEKMVRNGVPIYEGIGSTVPESHEDIKTKVNLLKSRVKNAPTSFSSYSTIPGIIKESIGSVFGKKTFRNFIPLLHVQVYKDAHMSLMKSGKSELEADQMAAEITRMSQGIMQDLGRAKITESYITLMALAPQYREGIIHVLGNMVNSFNPVSRQEIIGEKGTSGAGGKTKYKYSFAGKDSPIRSRKYRQLRLLMGGVITLYTMYNLLNRKLNNGQNMWDNPPGKEFDLRIPHADGTVTYVTFMTSFMTIPRAILGAGISLEQGDPASAVGQGAKLLSPAIALIAEMASNKNYYGNPIYKPTDTATQAYEKLIAYAGTELSPPQIKALVSFLTAKGTYSPLPLGQALIMATALPLTFSSVVKEQENDVFNALSAQAKQNANINLEAEQEWSTLKGVAKNQGKAAASAQFEALLKSNPTMAKSIATIATQEKDGMTATDRATLLLDVKNGDRAKYLYQEIMKLPADQRSKYYGSLITKKIVDNTVSEQIASLVKNGGISSNPKEGPSSVSPNAKADTFEGHPTFGGDHNPDTILSGKNSDDGQVKDHNPNNEPIYARDSAYEEEMKKTLFNQDSYWKDNGYKLSDLQYDHIIPLEAGGTNTKNNVQLITKSADEANQAMEDYLGALYKDGKISRADAAKASIDYKINQTVSLTDVMNGKY